MHEVTYSERLSTIEGTYWASEEAVGDDAQLQPFTSTYIGQDSLAELMAAHPDIVYTADVSQTPIWVSLLSSLLPMLLLMGVMRLLHEQVPATPTPSAMQFGKTKAQTTDATRPKVKFSDVAGCDEAIEELQEIKDFLENPEKYQEIGAKIPHGVLLVGPPGTGKTLLAKAVAGEAGVPFFSISGSGFVEMFVGVGASRVRDLFSTGQGAAPPRSSSSTRSTRWAASAAPAWAAATTSASRRSTSCSSRWTASSEHQSVILIAATNRPDILDPALLRPGRFDRRITVDRPDVKGREEILKIHARNKPLSTDVKLDKIAQLTPGLLRRRPRQPHERVRPSGRPPRSHAHRHGRGDRVHGARHRRPRPQEPRDDRAGARPRSPSTSAGHALVGHTLAQCRPGAQD